MVDDPDDIYRRTVQVSELNALNASLAVVRYKQLRGFYLNDNRLYHLLVSVEQLHTFGMTEP